MKIKIEKEDGEEFNEIEEDSGLLINIILPTMWSSIGIKLNHTLVSS